jgi:hypothetical protein
MLETSVLAARHQESLRPREWAQSGLYRTKAARLAKNSATEEMAGALDGAARDFYEKGTNDRAGVLSTVRRHTKFLDYTARRFDRELPHRFTLVPHDWIQAELDEGEFRMQQAQLAKKPIRKQRWYAKSFHVSFDYLGQRNDIMTIFGQKEAVAVATRLKAVDDVLDAIAHRGQGTPLSPEKEWHDQPGAIPETV